MQDAGCVAEHSFRRTYRNLSYHRDAFARREVKERARGLCARAETRLALVAQLDRASDFYSEGCWFESNRARQVPVAQPDRATVS